MPDLDVLGQCIVEALAELREADPVSRRWGLVLGGGGVLGGAWMVGALTALQEVHGLDARDAEVIVGTSAGSVTAALLGAGVTVDELRAHQLGDRPVPARCGDAGLGLRHARRGLRTRRGPGCCPAAPQLVARNAAGCAGCRRRRCWPRFCRRAAARWPRSGSWSRALVAARRLGTHPGVRAVAMDYESGTPRGLRGIPAPRPRRWPTP